MKSEIISKPVKSGINVRFKNKSYNLIYPKKIWKAYPFKHLLTSNYIPLATISLPLLLNLGKIHYNYPAPIFYERYKELMEKDLPSSTYDYTHQNATKMIKKFLQIKFNFKGKQQKKEIKHKIKQIKSKHHAIIPLSLGKDSLLTLAVSQEIGLNPASVYINDTVSPKENRLKLVFGKKLSKEFKLKHYVVTNNIEKINDFDTWKKPETSINYSHMITGFCFLALPFVNFFNSKYIILGNQQDMNFTFKDKEGYLIYPAFDQHKYWTNIQNKMLNAFTEHEVHITSVIQPLTNIAIIKILHKRYPKIAKYQISCDCINTSRDKRWCNKCNKCARLALFMKAFGINTKKLGLRNLFDKKNKHLYALFSGKGVDRYEKSIEAKEQQLLGFLLASRLGERGYLIDFFKKHYLEEAELNEERLRKKYFGIWESTLPKEIKQDVCSIYKEEMQKTN